MLESKYPEVQFMVTNVLGNGEHFVSLVANRLEETTPELWSGAAVSPAGTAGVHFRRQRVLPTADIFRSGFPA